VTQANFLPARRAPVGFVTEIGHISCPADGDRDEGDLMIRQEDLRLTPDD
jgi:hypothetical protein